MPLVKCPDCGNQISSTAEKCIHCGRDIKRNFKGCYGCFIYFIIGIILFLFFQDAMCALEKWCPSYLCVITSLLGIR